MPVAPLVQEPSIAAPAPAFVIPQALLKDWQYQWLWWRPKAYVQLAPFQALRGLCEPTWHSTGSGRSQLSMPTVGRLQWGEGVGTSCPDSLFRHLLIWEKRPKSLLHRGRWQFLQICSPHQIHAKTQLYCHTPTPTPMGNSHIHHLIPTTPPPYMDQPLILFLPPLSLGVFLFRRGKGGALSCSRRRAIHQLRKTPP